MKKKELRRLQMYEEQMLFDITQVCEEYNLRYFLIGGTAIGAVRHQGFIPWDDDIDIAMPFDDYMKFLNIAQNGLGKEYFVQSSFSDDSHIYAYAKVRKNGTTMIPKNMERVHTHQGIWIDIFPIACFNNSFEFEFKRRLLPMSTHLVMDEYIESFEESFANRLGKLAVTVHKLVFKIPFKVRKYVHDKLNMYICGGKGRKYCAEVFDLAKKYPYNIVEGQPMKMKFEEHNYSMFPGYKTYLEIKFGNYMELPPVEAQVNHALGILDFDKDYSEFLL